MGLSPFCSCPKSACIPRVLLEHLQGKKEGNKIDPKCWHTALTPTPHRNPAQQVGPMPSGPRGCWARTRVSGLILREQAGR